MAAAIIGFPEFSSDILELFLKLSPLLVGSDSFRLELVELFLLGINFLREFFGGTLCCSPAFLDAREFCLNLIDACCNTVDFAFQVVYSHLVCLSLSIEVLKLGLIRACSRHELGTKSVVFSAVLLANLAALFLHLFFVVVFEDLARLLHAVDALLNLLNNLYLLIAILGEPSNLGLKPVNFRS